MPPASGIDFTPPFEMHGSVPPPGAGRSSPEIDLGAEEGIFALFTAGWWDQLTRTTRCHQLLIAMIRKCLRQGQDGVWDRLILSPGERAASSGQFLLHGFLGEGTFGIVFSVSEIFGDPEGALHGKPTPTLAIKLTKPDLREEVLNDIWGLDRAKAPGVLRLHDYRLRPNPLTEEPPYVLTDLAHTSLAAYLDQHGKGSPKRLPPQTALKLFRRIVETMAHVHALQVVHSDLTPGNVLMTAAGDPVIGDFGQARDAMGETFSPGTPYFMPPDQAEVLAHSRRGEQADPAEVPHKNVPRTAWDVYALGALLYFISTGERPYFNRKRFGEFERGPAYDKLMAYSDVVKNGPPPRLDGKDRPVRDRELCKIMKSCLSHDPTQRPANAGRVLNALEKIDRHRKRMPWLVGGGLATLFVALILGYFGYGQERVYLGEAEAKLSKQYDVSAQAAANLGAMGIGHLFQDRVRRLQQMVKGSELFKTQVQSIHEKVTKQPPEGPLAKWIATEDRDAVSQWLVLRADEYFRSAAYFNGMATTVVVHGKGHHVARIDENRLKIPFDGSQYWDIDWSYRDWFNGVAGPESKPSDSGKMPITETHISAPYLGQNLTNSALPQGDQNRKWLISISVPLVNDTRTVGILVSSIDARSFSNILLNCFQSTRSGNGGVWPLIVDDRGYVLNLIDDRGEGQESVPCRIDDASLAVLRRSPNEGTLPQREWFAGPEQSRIRYLTPSTERVNPFAGRSFRVQSAGFRPYPVESGTARHDTVWHVLVFSEEGAIREPVEELRSRIASMWVTLVLFFAVAFVLLLGVVFRATRRQEVTRG